MKVKFQVNPLVQKPDELTADVAMIVEARYESDYKDAWKFRGAFPNGNYADLYIKALEKEYNRMGWTYRARRTTG